MSKGPEATPETNWGKRKYQCQARDRKTAGRRASTGCRSEGKNERVSTSARPSRKTKYLTLRSNMCTSEVNSVTVRQPVRSSQPDSEVSQLRVCCQLLDQNQAATAATVDDIMIATVSDGWECVT